MDRGVILAHIAPMGPGDVEAQVATGLPHFMAKAKEAVALMKQNQALFDGSTATWGIFGRVGTIIPLDHYAAWVTQLFEQTGIPAQLAYYDVNITGGQARRLPTGSVVVVKKRDERPRLFIEDREQMSTRGPERAVAGPSTQTAAGPMSRTVASGSSRAMSNPAVQAPFAQSTQTQTSRAAGGPSTHATTQSVVTAARWESHGGTYFHIQGTTVLAQQSEPPLNQPFLLQGRYVLWDGRNRWADDGRGGWERI